VSRLRSWSTKVRREFAVLKLAAVDPRVPKSAKWLAGAAVAYAISPIDLIPDFIPIVGQLDDLLIVPGLAWLALRQIDPSVMADLRAKAVAEASEA
jgi:uncharacterized membrane protein YkvA (DUF1232 family)